MIKDAFESLGDFFSKLFLGGYFLPALLVILLNVALYLVGVTGLSEGLAWARDQVQLADLPTTISLLAAISVILAFLAAPFSVAMRQLLAGAYLPGWLQTRWKNRHRQRTDELRNEVQTHRAAHAEVMGELRKLAPIVQAARRTGAALGTVTQPALIDEAALAVTFLRVEIDAARSDPAGATKVKHLVARLQDVTCAVAKALESNSAKVDPQARKDTDADARRLDVTAIDLRGCLTDIDILARGKLKAAAQALSGQYDPENIRPTRFGNYSAVMEAYPRRAYDVAYDFIAPRLDLVLVAENGFNVLDRARIQVESAITFLVLACLSLVVWFIALLIVGAHGVTFVSVAVALLVVPRFLYEAVVQAQNQHAERFQAALDANRFALLKSLHVKLPDATDDERLLWQQLQELSAGNRGPAIALDHTEATL